MAITQKSRIKVRSGAQADLPQLATGELGWSIDQRRLFIGNGLTSEGAPTLGNTEILTVYSPLTSLNINTSQLTLSSTILPLGFYTPTTNTIGITSRSADVLRLSNPASSINSLTVTGGATGVGPTISSYGESGRNINFTPNGAGNVVITSGTLAISSLTQNYLVYTGASGQLSGSSSLQFTGTNLGIGGAPTGTWGGSIHVVQISGAASIYGDATNGVHIGANTIDTGAGNVAINTAAGALYSAGTAGHTWYNIPSVSAGAAQTPATAMSLSVTNGLGIGVAPNTLPASYSGLQLLSGVIASDNAGTITYYSGAYNDGTEKYISTANSTKYQATPTGHTWTVSNGAGHVANDTITWLPTAMSISTTGLVRVSHGFAASLVTETTAARTILDTDYSVIANYAGTTTMTLPSAVTYAGRILKFKTITNNTVISNSSNVVPLAGGAATTAMLAATAGKWCELQSDGTSWQIMSSN